ncbi:AraC family transcriptional regulator, partial [Arcobacter sp. 31_11_sub10_T18]
MQKHLEMIQDLVDKIEKDVSYDVNILSLSNSFDISPWHFQRLFKSIVGDSLGSYTRGRRLSLAATMLQTTKLSIVDIAFEVGFNSHE